MCGIWLSLGIDAPKTVISSVAHRGPDGEGWRRFATSSGPLILAHRRLAVFDTSNAGHQPMSYQDERFWLVYNGEIYNHIELRDELTGLGYSFRSTSDSEVLLAAYAEWGESCLDQFNGMFAFIIWDSKDDTLFAARDRFGIKPLYFWQSTTGISFASEIKQFTQLDDFSAHLNPASAYDFLTTGFLDHTEATMFKGVQQLRAGECLTLNIDKGGVNEAPRTRRWYTLPVFGSIKMSSSDAIARFRELFVSSVELRLRSDIPVGSCLSGGLDSSAIVCVAADTNPGFVTVSACYKDWIGDESVFMQAVNERIESKPVQVFPDFKNLEASLDQLVYHQDSPFGSTSAFAQWCVFAAAQKAGASVMLDGQGADEQLAGYHPAFAAYHSTLLRRGNIGLLLKELSGVRDRHNIGFIRQLLKLINATLPNNLRRKIHDIRRISKPDWLKGSFVKGHDEQLANTNNLNNLLSDQMAFATLPGLLHSEDRSSMAFGVESRLPFLDYRLVELLAGLGDQHKIVDGETKWALRRALSGVLPDMIVNRQDKVAFATPENDWLKGPLRGLVKKGVEEAGQRFPDLFSMPELQLYCDQMLAGKRAYDKSLWRIISFGAWGRVFNVEG